MKTIAHIITLVAVIGLTSCASKKAAAPDACCATGGKTVKNVKHHH